MSSGYGKRMHPKLKRIHMHAGHDFAPLSDFWNTEVYATANGTVKKSINLPKTYGQYIEIDHGNGIISTYSHLDEILVSEGDLVSKKSKIATIGSSGRVTGPHLHFEIILFGTKIDPLQFL